MNSRRKAWWSSLRSVLSPCGKSSLSLTSMPSSAPMSFIASSRPRKPDFWIPSLRKLKTSKLDCTKRSGSGPDGSMALSRSEEHTSELQSRLHLVCRLLLEKKKRKQTPSTTAQDTTHCKDDT